MHDMAMQMNILYWKTFSSSSATSNWIS